MAGEEGGVVGVARLKVTPDSRSFGKDLQKGTARAASNTGRSISRRLNDSINAGSKRAANALRDNVNKSLDQTAAKAANTGRTVGSGLTRGVNSSLPALTRMKAGFADSRTAAAEFSGTAGTIGGKLRTGFDAGRKGASALGKAFNTSANNLRNNLSGVNVDLRQTAKLAGGLVIGSGLVGLGKQAFDLASATQETTSAMTGLYRSGDKARDVLDRVSKISKGSPLDDKSFLEAGKAMAYMGVSGGKAEGVIKNLNKAVVASGHGSEAMGQVTEALLDMQNQGKATADNVNRISQAGVPAWEALATAAGKSVGEMHDAVSNGEVSMEDMLNAIQQGAGETFGGLQAGYERVMGSFGNRTKLAKKEVVGAFSEMIKPLLDNFGPAVTRVGDMISNALRQIPNVLSQIQQFMAPTTAAFSNLWTVVQPLLASLGQGFGAGLIFSLQSIGSLINNVVAPALNWLSGMIQGMPPGFQGLIGVIGGVAGALTGVVMVSRQVTKVIGLARGAFNLLSKAFSMSPIGRVISLIALLVGGFMTLWNKSEGFRNFWKGLWNAVVAAAKWAWNNMLQPIFEGFKAAVQAVGNAFQAVGQTISNIWQGIVDACKSAVNAVISVINGITSGINKVTGIVGIPAIPQIPKLEKGGPAKANQLHLVGEQGPELFVPKVSGTVVPNHKLRSGPGTVLRERTQETTRDTGRMAGRMNRVRVDMATRAEDVDNGLNDRIERALSGWRVEMDSRGVARLARDGNRRLAPIL